MQCKKPAGYVRRINRKRASSHQLWCKLSVKLHSQCDVCEGSQGQYRDLPRVGSDHVSNEGCSWRLYCYALQSQVMQSMTHHTLGPGASLHHHSQLPPVVAMVT